MTGAARLGPLAASLRATQQGRRLRLRLAGSDRAFLIDPLPAGCGLAISRAFVAQESGHVGDMPPDSVMAEALGPENYATVTGNSVQEFDDTGRYVRTALPGAVMVEPLEDVPPIAPGQRSRVAVSGWDGLGLRIEEARTLALAAFYWQSVGGCEALDAYLRAGGGAAGERAGAAVVLNAMRRHPLLGTAPPPPTLSLP